jgi:type IV pilus assembly protein PilM
MAARVIGLDIGSYAVRAVQLTLGGQPTLERFAQVTLPPGAVRDGEVVDPAAVATALRRLWSEGGFRGKRVVVGVANQRVIVRQAELPSMSVQDLRAALRFEAQDLIPIPIEDAILDFQVLEDSVSDGEPRMRVLLAAAQRDMVRSHLAAVEGAGLTATAVDVVPFALVRALTDPGAAFEGDGSAEAIVCIGGGVTNVVVHEQGIPRFVRVLLVGGDDITDAIARELDIDLDTAEDLKRRSDMGSGDAAAAQAANIISNRIGTLVEEIRGSLDYYLAQSQSVPISRVLVTGGGSRLLGLMERLRSQLGGRVEPARPLASVRLGAVDLGEDQLSELEPLLAVPLGLALGGETQKGQHRISLVPTEMAAVRETRRQTALALGGVGALATVLLLAWLAQAARVRDEEKKAATEEARAAAVEREAATFGDATALSGDIASRRGQVQVVLADDVAWTKLFSDIATVIPNDVWLTAFSGTKGPTTSVTFTAQGFDQTSTARWLLRMSDLRSLGGLWVPNSTKAGSGSTSIVNFTSTATITPAAYSDRLKRFQEGQ